MIMDQEAVQALALTGRVMAEEIPVQDSIAIRVDITIKVIRTISSSSRVTRATQNS